MPDFNPMAFNPNGEIPYSHIIWNSRTYSQSENRTATLSLDLPFEILFRLLVAPEIGFAIQKCAATYFVNLAQTRLEDVVEYLRSFFLKLNETCNMSSPELTVISIYHGSDFDFPRPSPSWLMMREFCRNLKPHAELYGQLKSMPIR
jgi:hypothetical protein